MCTAKFLVPAALAVLAGPIAAGLIGAGVIGGGVTAVPAGAATVSAAVVAPAPKPPVITENFNPPFACNQKSNLGVQGCAERQVDTGDARINAEVKLLFRVLYDNASRRALVTAEHAWLAYRGADCTSQSDEYEGGSQQPIAYLQCLAADDRSRSTDLKGFYQALTAGRHNVPAFP
jgi:uncharacterized protein YecT (DUF1311 family)